MTALKLRQIGNSVGAIFPRDILAEMQVGEGDTIFVVRTPDGFRLTKSDPDFETQMEAGRRLMKRWHNVLRELAK